MSSLAEEHLGVAVVDDDPNYRELICATVAKKSKFVIFEASSGKELLNILAMQRIDCIVLDYDLGEESGLAVIQRIDETYTEPPPVIMMTGAGRESTAIRAFRMGVSDYLPKVGLRPEHLVASVIKVVERDRQESLAKIEHKRLVAASGVDIVTGLEGRTRLEERLNQLALLPPLSRASYALILVEFVEYQRVKERFGLKIADQCLRAFGKRLHELGRSSDVCGRHSGATFLIITDVGSGVKNLEAICRRLAGNLSFRLNFDLADISISACVAGSRCLETVHSDRADALYLLEPVAAMLAQAKTASLPFKAALDACLDSSPLAASELSDPANSEAPPSAGRLDARPAADELRATDRRRQTRQRVFKRGLIHMINTEATFNCIVRNISSHGAGLRIDAAYPIPETFDLEIAGSGERQRVRVRWQTGIDLGVEFANVTSSSAPAIHRFFEPEMEERMVARQALKVDLTAALSNDELEIDYQPIVDLRTGAVASFEALLRWRHPRRGRIPPSDFIPLAEETGLIGPIGDWTVEQACVEAMAWAAYIGVAVNVSPVQFRDRSLARRVAAILAKTGLPAHRLELEITETVLLHDSEDNLRCLHDLRQLGVKIALDDFGTGHSSLGYLQRFPFDKIKIDRSFLMNVIESPEARAVIRAVIGLGHSINMRITAEGVESQEQLKYLVAEGCDEAQGFLISRPVGPQQVQALIAEQAVRGGGVNQSIEETT